MRWTGDLEVGDESLWRKMKRRMKTMRNEQFIVTFLAEKRCHNLGLRLFSFSIMFCVLFLVCDSGGENICAGRFGSFRFDLVLVGFKR